MNPFFSSIIQGLIAMLWNFSFDMPAPDVDKAVMLMMKFFCAAADDFNEILGEVLSRTLAVSNNTTVEKLKQFNVLSPPPPQKND